MATMTMIGMIMRRRPFVRFVIGAFVMSGGGV
jgi:hypothetical protein